LAWARDELEDEHVIAVSQTRNKRSVALLRKLGFTVRKGLEEFGTQQLLLERDLHEPLPEYAGRRRPGAVRRPRPRSEASLASGARAPSPPAAPGSPPAAADPGRSAAPAPALSPPQPRATGQLRQRGPPRPRPSSSPANSSTSTPWPRRYSLVAAARS